MPIAYQATRISNVKVSKLLNDKLSLQLLLNFVFAIRFNIESQIKCGFIVQYESIFKKYLQKVFCKEQDTPKSILKIQDKILSCILKILSSGYYLAHHC